MRNNIAILCACILIMFSANDVHSKIIFKDVSTTGVGQSLEEAVNNALAEAITMVNGKNVHTKTVIKVLGGEKVPSNDDVAQEAKDFIINKFEELNALLRSEDGQKVRDPINVNVDVNTPKREKYTQEYVKDIVDEVKGGVKSYEILEKKIDDGWHHVTVKSKIAQFEIPQEAQRTRIAIVPFRFYPEKNAGSSILDKVNSLMGVKDSDNIIKTSAKLFKLSSSDEERMLRLMSQGLSNYLVQSRKFTILDREYVSEISEEQLNIEEGRAPIEELAKLGNEISGDFVFVGSIEEFTVEDKVTKILTSDKEIVRKIASFYISYRVLDVATKQIIASNFVKVYHVTKSDRPIEIISTMTEKASQIIGQELLFSIYPIIVEKYSQGELYLAHGGSSIKKGDEFELFAKGEKIIDSYTNEVIGNVEDYIGKIKISSVTSNFSKGRLIDEQVNIGQDFISGQYIARPVKFDEEAAKLEDYKKAMEKIKKLREERKKTVEKRKEMLAEKMLQKRKEIEKRREERAKARDELRKSREGVSDDDF
mgnify:CR=1 FL=1|tara:strand:- start:2924 stop:4534 length:1611 start_codon:yes stop_codon:yes gene_type:complete